LARSDDLSTEESHMAKNGLLDSDVQEA